MDIKYLSLGGVGGWGGRLHVYQLSYQINVGQFPPKLTVCQ